MALQDDVIDVVATQLGVDKAEVTSESSIVDDLGADSLDLTELNMALEDHFKCEIPIEKAAEMKTVRQIVEYIEANRPQG